MALAAAISGCGADPPRSSQSNLTPAGTPLTWTSDLSSHGPAQHSATGRQAYTASPSRRSEQAAGLAATGATHQLLATGFGAGPEDRAVIFANPPAMERIIALADDAEGQAALAALGEQDKLELLHSFACFPRAGSPVRLVRESGEVAWIEVTAGDRAGCAGVVQSRALLDAKDLYQLDNLMGPFAE
jgi:hypothetical protein